jgi:serine phosphatase RsbU (regulator of sigma subunit)
VFSTDGIVESISPSECPYGAQRLKSQVLRLGMTGVQELCAGILSDLEAHCGTRPRSDDLTLLALRYRP